MGKADEVILTGCSAGGLATYLHADYVASVIPQSAKFRAMADAGYVQSCILVGYPGLSPVCFNT